MTSCSGDFSTSQGADNKQLDDWLDRILDARELSDVFGAEKQKHH